MVVYGTSCVLVEKDDEGDFHIILTNPHDFWVDTDLHNKIHFCIRKVTMSAESAQEWW